MTYLRSLPRFGLTAHSYAVGSHQDFFFFFLGFLLFLSCSQAAVMFCLLDVRNVSLGPFSFFLSLAVGFPFQDLSPRCRFQPLAPFVVVVFLAALDDIPPFYCSLVFWGPFLLFAFSFIFLGSFSSLPWTCLFFPLFRELFNLDLPPRAVLPTYKFTLVLPKILKFCLRRNLPSSLFPSVFSVKYLILLS